MGADFYNKKAPSASRGRSVINHIKTLILGRPVFFDRLSAETHLLSLDSVNIIYNIYKFVKCFLENILLKTSSFFKVSVFSVVIVSNNHKRNVKRNKNEDYNYYKFEPEGTGHIGKILKTA